MSEEQQELILDYDEDGSGETSGSPYWEGNGDSIRRPNFRDVNLNDFAKDGNEDDDPMDGSIETGPRDTSIDETIPAAGERKAISPPAPIPLPRTTRSIAPKKGKEDPKKGKEDPKKGKEDPKKKKEAEEREKRVMEEARLAKETVKGFKQDLKTMQRDLELVKGQLVDTERDRDDYMLKLKKEENENEKLRRDILTVQQKAKEEEDERRLFTRFVTDSIAGRRSPAPRRPANPEESEAAKFVIAPSHLLHPDHRCDRCGVRRAKDVFGECEGVIGEMTFSTMRSLAAVRTLMMEGGTRLLSPLEMTLRLQSIREGKLASASTLAEAYKYGTCYHACGKLAELMNQTIKIEGATEEEEKEIVGTLMGRTDRPEAWLLLPQSSLLARADGRWKEILVDQYEESTANLMEIVEKKRGRGMFPRMLIIVTSSEDTEEKVKKIVKNLEKVCTEEDARALIHLDLTPSAPSDERKKTSSEMIEMYTRLSLELRSKKVSLACNIHGLIEGLFPIQEMFRVCGEEKKEYYENVISHYIKGARMKIPKRDLDESNRSHGGWKRKAEWGGGDREKKRMPSETTILWMKDKKCNKCTKMGHVREYCHLY